MPIYNSTKFLTLPQQVNKNKKDIVNIEDGSTLVKKAEQDQLGNVINTTYETKTDANLVRGRVTLLENANMVKSVSYEALTHKITFTFYDNTTQLLDLPLESAIVGASYDNATKDITFTLQNGSTLIVPLDDLVSGFVNETWVNTNFIPKTSIVDNLTTNDATKVLSAKQGKVLQDTKADATHTHTKSQITDFPTSMPPTAHSTDLITSGTLGIARGGTGRTDGYSVGVVETRANVLTKIWTGTQAQYDAIGTTIRL